MSLSAIFLLIALFASVALIVVWPLIYSRETLTVQPSSVISLETRHEAVLKAIRDLDFDYQTGKLVQVDYQNQRQGLVEQGVEILKEIDMMKAAPKDNPDDESIEAAIQTRRAR